MLPWRHSGFECGCGSQSEVSMSSSNLESKQLENTAQSLLTDLLASTHIVGGYSKTQLSSHLCLLMHCLLLKKNPRHLSHANTSLVNLSDVT